MEENGLISLGFNRTAFVFAFLFNGDTSFSGSIKHLEIRAGPELELLSSLIRAKQGVNFVGIWALVAEWRDVPVLFTPEKVSAKILTVYDIMNSVFRAGLATQYGYPVCPYSISCAIVLYVLLLFTE